MEFSSLCVANLIIAFFSCMHFSFFTCGLLTSGEKKQTLKLCGYICRLVVAQEGVRNCFSIKSFVSFLSILRGFLQRSFRRILETTFYVQQYPVIKFTRNRPYYPLRFVYFSRQIPKDYLNKLGLCKRLHGNYIIRYLFTARFEENMKQSTLKTF